MTSAYVVLRREEKRREKHTKRREGKSTLREEKIREEKRIEKHTKT